MGQRGWLILSRKPGQAIRVDAGDGREVWVMVAEVGGGQVKIGIDAPRDWGVIRVDEL